MKLNLTKGAFSVDLCQFLDFMVSEIGIGANPKKIRKIINMKQFQNINEVQKLIGQMAKLNKCVSRSIDKCLSFFKILWKAQSWNDECDKEFRKLKEYLSNPPLQSQAK